MKLEVVDLDLDPKRQRLLWQEKYATRSGTYTYNAYCNCNAALGPHVMGWPACPIPVCRESTRVARPLLVPVRSAIIK